MANKKRNHKQTFYILKLLVTLSLCVFILWKIDLKNIWLAIQNSNPMLISIIFMAMVLNVFLSTFKWKLLLSMFNIHFDFTKLYKYYFTATFFNNFLPSTVGGDGYRIYKTFKNPHSKEGAIIAILLERFTGILALLFLGFIGGIVIYIQTGNKVSQFAVLSGAIAFSILILFFSFKIWKTGIIKYLTSKYFPQRFQKVLSYIKNYHYNFSKIVLVFLLSLFFQFFLIIYRLMLIYAVGESISIFGLAVVVAVSTIVALVPVSINGIGLMDGSYIYLLVNFGVGYEQAVIVMLLIRALQLPLSLVGGVFYFFDKKSLHVNNCEQGV